MRGPGAVPGLYATESAMNELADQLKIDPVQLRVLNEPKIDESLGLPFSSRHLLECFELGAEKFGWSKRTPEVGSMKRDGLTLGWGMAGCSWIAARFPAEASVQLRDDGTARVACGTQDIGTGTYTILAQLASQKTGVPLDKVEVALGDTTLPAGPISGGSMATGSVVPAVFAAADSAIASLLTIATTTPGSPFEKRKPDDLAFEGGRVFVKADGPAEGVPFADVLRRANLRLVTGNGKSEATFGDPKPKFSTHSFGCHFVEVTWQPEIARLRVSRVVTVIDAGRILNPLAGRNQIEGAVVMGIGMALFEHTTYDPQNGAPINSNLADYMVAVNADVPPIDVHFLDYPDKEINELGARGIGEIGLAGIAAAITAAVHHATGVRVRRTAGEDRGSAGSGLSGVGRLRSSGAVRSRSESPDRPFSQLDADVLRFREEIERLEAALASDAALLHPAEGNTKIPKEPRVDPDRPALDRRGDPMGLLEVPGPDARRQPVARAVREGDRLLGGIEGRDGDDRPEDLLLHDAPPAVEIRRSPSAPGSSRPGRAPGDSPDVFRR